MYDKRRGERRGEGGEKIGEEKGEVVEQESRAKEWRRGEEEATCLLMYPFHNNRPKPKHWRVYVCPSTVVGWALFPRRKGTKKIPSKNPNFFFIISLTFCFDFFFWFRCFLFLLPLTDSEMPPRSISG